MSTPMTNICVCSGVRLTPDYTHTIYFNDSASQWAYFVGKVAHEFTGYSYIRKSWSIKVHATMNQAKKWSYMFFTNGDKIWYYFITNIEYINDSTVELFVEMDVMQSYMFDYTLLDCFVEREHTALDVIGDNLVDEGLDVGEYVSIADKDVDLNDYRIMILATGNPATAANGDSEIIHAFGTALSNVFCGLGVYCVKLGDAMALKTILNKLDESGVSDMIVAMWMYPGELIQNGDYDSSVAVVSGASSFNENVTRNTVLDGGYTPRNNKLFCYPYNFLYVTNNTGGAAVYHYERFGDPTNPYFKIVGSVSPDGCVRMYPLNYKGSQHNFESGLTLGSFPTCAWDSDVYKMWLAQNQNTLNVAGATSVIKAVAGVGVGIAGLAMGNFAMAGSGAVSAYSGAVGIAELLAQRADKSIQPDEAKGVYSSTVNMTAGFQTFTIRKKCITRAQAIILDEYFDMYGYKTLIVKKPNRNCRENWTYTKTIGCQIAGNICTDDKIKIESVYNKGVTFWVNGDSIGNYSLSNKCTGEV